MCKSSIIRIYFCTCVPFTICMSSFHWVSYISTTIISFLSLTNSKQCKLAVVFKLSFWHQLKGLCLLLVELNFHLSIFYFLPSLQLKYKDDNHGYFQYMGLHWMFICIQLYLSQVDQCICLNNKCFWFKLTNVLVQIGT